MSSCWTVLRAACALVILSVPVAAQEPSRTLSLPQALQRALAANPRLTAADRDIGIATGKSIQAGALPNPELSAAAENVAGSGPYRGLRSAETTLQLSQLIELGGKRDARISAGLAEADGAYWQRQAVRLEVLSDAATAYINVLAAQRRIKILDDQVAALDRLQPLLQRRVEAGASSQPEVLRAQVAADLVRVERERAKTALASARRELALLMGDSYPRFGGVAGQLNDARQPAPFRSITDAIDGNPQLMRWTAVRAQRDAELLTARLKPIPDVRASVGWRHFRESGDNAATFGLSMSLPLWDQNKGDIIAANAALDKVQADRAINKSALLAVAGKSYDAAAGALQEVNLLRGSVLPNARRAAQAIEDGYGQGRFTLLELLDVQATLADAQLREQEALRTFHTAVATIEGLVGRPFTLATGARR
jgi:cobalt-zinc-cadmium efflux system outer membrane protein